jgi:DNA polymerase-3 subunit beta
MEFKIKSTVFNKALQKIQGIIERSTMAILSNALLEVCDGMLYVTATDLIVGIKSSYPVEMIGEGTITVPAKKLYEIIKEMQDLPEGEILFRTKANDWIEVIGGEARFNLVGLSSAEYPYFPKINEGTMVTFTSGILKDMFEKTSYAGCKDETKFNLNGVFIKTDKVGKKDVLRMVATDGHRMAFSEKEISGCLSPELNKGVIFPNKGVDVMKKMVEEGASDVMMGFMDNSVVIKMDNSVIVMRLVDGEFPDYSKFIPANKKIVLADKKSFLHALKRMALLASDKFKGVKIAMTKDHMVISSNNPELGDATEMMVVHYEGEAFAARYNATYILDVLLSMGAEHDVELQFKDELAPVVVKSAATEDFMAVVMPMRL